MAEPTMPTSAQTLRGMVLGLLPCAGDASDLADGAAALRDAVVCWGRVLLRLAALAVLPVSLLVLYPIVRLEQRKRLEFDLERERRRREVMDKLAKHCQKPVEWPNVWPDPKTYGQVLSPKSMVVGRPEAPREPKVGARHTPGAPANCPACQLEARRHEEAKASRDR